MSTYEKPDGTIEIGFSGCCCPPGQRRAGQHTNSATVWWRLSSGEWKIARTQSLIRRAAAEADTCDAFVLRVNEEYL